MGIWKKMGTAMGHAVVKAGKKTAAAIKKKNLQNKVEKMILERFTVDQLKKIIREYDKPGPELPERGYYKKSDYVNYVYRNFRLKTVIQWAQAHKIKIKDIMDYYRAEMDKIDKQYGDTKAEDREQGVEEIEYKSEKHLLPEDRKSPLQSPQMSSQQFVHPDKRFFDELLDYLEYDFGPSIYDIAFVDEMDFKNHVLADLRRKYRGKRIEFNPQSVDITIDEKYGLELKFAYYKETLRRGYYEIVKYKRLVNYLAIVILDPGILPQSEIEKTKEDYQNLGAEVVIIRGGQKRSKRKRGKEIRIRM